MGILQGKGIWTLYDDITTAADNAASVGADFILCKVSSRGLYNETSASAALTAVRSRGLRPVAWTYSYLEDVEGEAQCAVRALMAGFEAFIIDAEASINGKTVQAHQLSQRMIQLGVDSSRIYLCTDPRIDSKIDEIPMRQLAPVCRGGFIPMIYGEIMPHDRPNAARVLMENAYANFSRHQSELGYTDALLPAIATYWDNQGHARMSYAELKRWCDEAEARQPAFVSLYRAGVTASDAWRAFAELVTVRVGGTVSPVDETLVGRKVSMATQVLVYPGGPGYSEGFYPPTQPGTGWTEFIDASSHPTRYRRTVTDQTMYASYLPSLTGSDRYVIEVFVPGIHATTREAQYFVTLYEGDDRIEKRVTVDQRTVSNVWVSLGVYDLDPMQAESGRVNLVDVTSDSTPREIAFSAIRWTPIGSASTFGFDPPIGTPEERAGSAVWPGQWKDANPYKSKYNLGFHTGADLNLNWPTWNLDKGAPVYACADGVVTFSAETGGSWQALVVIEHTMPDNTRVYSRYGHVDKRIVKQGDRVVRGQQIARVGQSGGEGGNYHLHFDISTTNVLKLNPQNWPGFDFQAVLRDYVEPRTFILAHRPGVR